MTVDMSDFDRAVARYEAVREIAKRMLAMGDSVEKICAVTCLSKREILALQNEDSEES